MSLKDWEDSKKSLQKIILLAPPNDRKMYEKMFFNIIKNPRTSSTRQAVQISTVVKILSTMENFHRLGKQSRKDTLEVLMLVSSSIGPNEFKLLYDSVYFKLKKKIGR